MEAVSPPPNSHNGISAIFPVVAVLSVLSNTLCLLLLPGFIKTWIISIVCLICWLLLGNGLLLLNMFIWRGNTRNIPIYSDIVARFWSIFTIAIHMSILCLTKFIWIISRPAPTIKLYDGWRRMNLIDGFLCIGVPLLMLPIDHFRSLGRYLIIEDLGPRIYIVLSVDSFLIDLVPTSLASVLSVGYSCMSCYNFWRSTPGYPGPDSHVELQHQHRILSTSQRLKYSCMSVVAVCGMLYGTFWLALLYIRIGLNPQGYDPWYTVNSFMHINERDRGVITWTREFLETEQQPFAQNIAGFACALPLIGIFLFLWFGLGSEVRKSYMEWIEALGAVIITVGTTLSGLVKGLTTKVGLWKRQWQRQTGMGPDDITPFRTDKITLEDLTVSRNQRKPSVRKTPAPSSFSSPIPPVYRGAPLPLYSSNKDRPLPTQIRLR